MQTTQEDKAKMISEKIDGFLVEATKSWEYDPSEDPDNWIEWEKDSVHVVNYGFVSKEDFDKKSFKVTSTGQIDAPSLTAKPVMIKSDGKFGTKQSGGSPNLLSVIVHRKVCGFLKELCRKNKGKYIRVSVGRRSGHMRSVSYGETFYIDADMKWPIIAASK